MKGRFRQLAVLLLWSLISALLGVGSGPSSVKMAASGSHVWTYDGSQRFTQVHGDARICRFPACSRQVGVATAQRGSTRVAALLPAHAAPPGTNSLHLGFGLAAETGAGETTTLFRAVGQHEADDIAAAGGYRNAPGLEGKYFFQTRGQAEQYGQMMNKAPGFGAPNYLTSGSVPTSALGSAEGMEAGSEGPGLFFRGELSDFFNVFNHGLIP